MADVAPVRPLTAALIDPTGLPLAREVTLAGRGFSDALALLARQRHGRGSLRLTDHDLRVALSEDHSPDRPFAWSAPTARRGLGILAVRALVNGQARTPTDGVRAAMAEAMRISQGQRPMSSMEGWLAGLGAAGRAAVAADAVTWATRLWTALEWSALPSLPIIGQDRWWDSPRSSLLALRSRAEVRCAIDDADGALIGLHLVVLGGGRRASVRDELSVVALAEALRAQAEPPGRVVGWWPDSGRLVRVDVNQTVLERGLETVAKALSGGQLRAAA
ncbi:MAG TPA: hypothetical protein VGH31_08985 [Acidimicrobiales bacterium]|jgi:hypothetical protein